jgi:hypothetical protein
MMWPGRLHLLPANVLQCLFAQNIGVALTDFRKSDDLPCDGLLYEIVGVFGPKSDAGDFECDTQDAHGLWVKPLAVKKLGDRHGNPPAKSQAGAMA